MEIEIKRDTNGFYFDGYEGRIYLTHKQSGLIKKYGKGIYEFEVEGNIVDPYSGGWDCPKESAYFEDVVCFCSLSEDDEIELDEKQISKFRHELQEYLCGVHGV